MAQDHLTVCEVHLLNGNDILIALPVCTRKFGIISRTNLEVRHLTVSADILYRVR